MLPTFVIGLREGLEAALIVGIVAAFLRRQGRTDLLRWAFAGIVAAITLCVAVGVILELVSRDLPQKQQEGLETVIGAVAVGMVSYMVVWMRRHSRDLKAQLEGAAGVALASGSGWALVAMAFLAVLREGLETAVFLLAAFNETGDGSTAGLGAVLGVAVAVALGWGIYRGGVRLNLSKFFRATGLVLVLVAAGLVVSALHTAHEAGWLNVGQQKTFDLSGVVRTGSLQSSILTGVLGLQPRPVLIEVIGWLVYLVPMMLYVGWKPGRAPSRATVARPAIAGGVLALVAAAPLLALRPAAPPASPLTRAGGLSAQVLSVTGNQAVIRATLPAGTTTVTDPARLASPAPGATAVRTLTLTRTATEQRAGTTVDVYALQRSTPLTGAPAQIELSVLAGLNGGRLPLGIKAASGSVPATYRTAEQDTVAVARDSNRVVDLRWQQSVTVLADSSVGTVPVKVAPATSALSASAVDTALRQAVRAGQDADRRHRYAVLGGLLLAAGVLSVLVGAGLVVTARRGAPDRVTIAAPLPEPVRS